MTASIFLDYKCLVLNKDSILCLSTRPYYMWNNNHNRTHLVNWLPSWALLSGLLGENDALSLRRDRQVGCGEVHRSRSDERQHFPGFTVLSLWLTPNFLFCNIWWVSGLRDFLDRKFWNSSIQILQKTNNEFKHAKLCCLLWPLNILNERIINSSVFFFSHKEISHVLLET